MSGKTARKKRQENKKRLEENGECLESLFKQAKTGIHISGRLNQHASVQDNIKYFHDVEGMTHETAEKAANLLFRAEIEDALMIDQHEVAAVVINSGDGKNHLFLGYVRYSASGVMEAGLNPVMTTGDLYTDKSHNERVKRMTGGVSFITTTETSELTLVLIQDVIDSDRRNVFASAAEHEEYPYLLGMAA